MEEEYSSKQYFQDQGLPIRATPRFEVSQTENKKAVGSTPAHTYTEAMLKAHTAYIFARVQLILASHMGPTSECVKQIKELEERMTV